MDRIPPTETGSGPAVGLLFRKQDVAGSIPASPTTFPHVLDEEFLEALACLERARYVGPWQNMVLTDISEE